MSDPTPPVAWPPGWYHDPEGGELLRWWDGTSWSDRTVTSEGLPTAASAEAPPPASRFRRRTRRDGRLALAAAVGIGLAAVAGVLVHIAPGESQRASMASLTTGHTSPAPSTSAAAATHPSATPSTPSAARTSPAARTFIDGTFRVPGDLPPGTYHTINRLDDCTWYRFALVGGRTTVVGQGIGDDGPAVATVLAGDVQFRSVDCGRWSSAPTGPAAAATQFDQGTFRVGVDIAPGSYLTAALAGCVWRRLSGFTGDPSAVIAEGHPDDPTTVTISPSDQGFYTIHCGQWRRT